MNNQFILILYAVGFLVIVGTGWYIKSLYDGLYKCKINSKVQEERYKAHMKSYDSAIDDITVFYDGKVDEVENFKRRENETDCEASKRFLNHTSY